jgi:hypothetical protein
MEGKNKINRIFEPLVVAVSRVSISHSFSFARARSLRKVVRALGGYVDVMATTNATTMILRIHY